AALEAERPEKEGGEPGYSPEAALRRKPFEECSERDIAAMERLLRSMVSRLATCRSRRLVPVRRGGLVDLRRSLRRALPGQGELFWLARRDRAVEEARLVLLCDTSGSMDAYTRFLLTFVLSLPRVSRSAEIFVFNTVLTRLTARIRPQKIRPTLDRLADAVPDWSGGTKIGDCLGEFVLRYADGLVTPKTVVTIVSDGLDRGDPVTIAAAMRILHRRARKVLWINPLMGDSRYEPTARGMAAALPFVDHLVPGHNLEALGHLLPLMAV
ncbi:MAG: VWA domain-containing protein, partial [Acidobacteriota bacterium]|nr:VWA domain-containing protein [Acidobacteriota bacterium]